MVSFLFIFLFFSSRVYSETQWSWQLEAQRKQSAQMQSIPKIESVSVRNQIVWVEGQKTLPVLRIKDKVTLTGKGFGAGPDIDLSKVLVGNIRALERDLTFFEGKVDYLKQLFYETSRPVGSWNKDILSWSDTQIEFTIPEIAYEGPIQVSIQKRTGFLPNLDDVSLPFLLKDPITERIRGAYSHFYDSISTLSDPILSQAIPVKIENPEHDKLIALGEKIYWAYDFNVGASHHLKDMDWEKVLNGKAKDPITGVAVDPKAAFGALPLVKGEVPEIALGKTYFDSYPSQNPIKPPAGFAHTSGYSTSTGYVGYVSVESTDPITRMKGSWIGFNCASCHSQRIEYENSPGHKTAKVFPGLPNPKWSMQWAPLGGMKGLVEKKFEKDSWKSYDRSLVAYAVPAGSGEHTIVRKTGDGSEFANDDFFSPIAIPIITRHTPIRRALAHGELIAGFEGSYIHAQEADGGTGAMHPGALKAFTAYMSSLDADHETLKRLSVFRHLKEKNRLSLVSGASEGEIVSKGFEAYPQLAAKLKSGQDSFNQSCLKCHQANFGMNTDERMFPYSEVGTYFGIPLFSKKNQSFRTAMIRDLYWVKDRGLLHDGHIKSIEDLVDPDRCNPSTDLYKSYYTLNSGTFKIAKGNEAQERALRKFKNFVDVPWDKKNLYYDYQGMRKDFGPAELGLRNKISLPASPHPWCVKEPSEIEDLALFLMTL